MLLTGEFERLDGAGGIARLWITVDGETRAFYGESRLTWRAAENMELKRGDMIEVDVDDAGMLCGVDFAA